MMQKKHKFNPWWFKRQVQNYGPWDYKRRGSQYENFGNFNYGATGRALGVGAKRLLREAGRVQQESGTSKPEWGDPGWLLNPWGGSDSYGDDPTDQKWIKEGIKYYDEGMWK